MRTLRSNKHINLTNHGRNRRLDSAGSESVVCRLYAPRWAGWRRHKEALVFDPQVGIYIWTAILVALVVGVVLLVRLVRRNQNRTPDPTEQSNGPGR